MADDLIRKSDVLETYAELYDIFDDNKAIQEELHKVFDKINDIPTVEPNSSEKPNNSTISKMEQVDKDINVRSKEPQTGEMMTEEEFDSMLARVLTGNAEPQTDCDGCQHYADKHTADACYECKRSYTDGYEPQTERSSE